MDTPDDRLEFERRFHLLAESMMNQKMFFPAGGSMTELGLRKIRTLPNGRLDFNSVDEFARLHANMMVQMEGLKQSMPKDIDQTKRTASSSIPPPTKRTSTRASKSDDAIPKTSKKDEKKKKLSKKAAQASKKRNRKRK